MAADDRMTWMWSEAMAVFSRAERLRGGSAAQGRTGGGAVWEPPVDIFETEAEVLVVVALPGVREEDIFAAIEGGALVVRGRRGFPSQLRGAFVHRLEAPRGAFERRIPLPSGHYGAIARTVRDGCLHVSLRKSV
ncbi:Hsp20/alpha crystallin family protein [Rhodoblastus sp.]|uniref:Hsp20/alpha crystallin family protein n=1 Tax=Rhodoblastus sp. TaxID=1962975 RepID=UPI002606EBBF|nr:Hsp20/alpha crystallin family protein [Rhodoblastus sp.]